MIHVISGYCGIGKTYFANEVEKLYGIPHIDLDTKPRQYLSDELLDDYNEFYDTVTQRSFDTFIDRFILKFGSNIILTMAPPFQFKLMKILPSTSKYKVWFFVSKDIELALTSYFNKNISMELYRANHFAYDSECLEFRKYWMIHNKNLIEYENHSEERSSFIYPFENEETLLRKSTLKIAKEMGIV